MNKVPLISVIIPVYRQAAVLGRSLKTLKQQTYQRWEAIVVDDGNSDQDRVRETRYFHDPRIKFFFRPHQGAPAARNFGLRQARGDYVIFWDADTIAKPEMLEKLKQQLNNCPKASYAYCQFRFGWKKMKSQPFNADDLRRYNYVDTTSLIRRGAVEDGRVTFDESLKRFQDWDLWLTFLEKNKVGIFIPEVLYTKIVRGKKGMSRWLPSFVYCLPIFSEAQRAYQQAREIVVRKHSL